jgi:hypothetical protein
MSFQESCSKVQEAKGGFTDSELVALPIRATFEQGAERATWVYKLWVVPGAGGGGTAAAASPWTTGHGAWLPAAARGPFHASDTPGTLQTNAATSRNSTEASGHGSVEVEAKGQHTYAPHPLMDLAQSM